jgi:hypothetical protein
MISLHFSPSILVFFSDLMNIILHNKYIFKIFGALLEENWCEIHTYLVFWCSGRDGLRGAHLYYFIIPTGTSRTILLSNSYVFFDTAFHIVRSFTVPKLVPKLDSTILVKKKRIFRQYIYRMVPK